MKVNLMKLLKIFALYLALLPVITLSNLSAMRTNSQVTLISVAYCEIPLEGILSYLNAEEKNNVRELSQSMRQIIDPLIRRLRVSKFNNPSFSRIQAAASFLKLLVVSYDDNDAPFVQDANQELLLPALSKLETLRTCSSVFSQLLANSLLVRKRPLLTEMKDLCISSRDATAKSLAIIILCCPNLENLSLGSNPNALRSIAAVLTKNPTGLMHLRKLNLHLCDSSESQIVTIIQCLPQLEDLNVSYNQNAPAAIVQALAANQAALENIKVLNLWSTYLTREQMAIIMRRCPHLEDLDIACCEEAPLGIIDALSGDSENPPAALVLLRLDLRETAITAEEMAQLIELYPNFEYLNLGECSEALVGIDELLQEHPDALARIKELEIVHTFPSATVIYAILVGCPLLEKFNTVCCNQDYAVGNVLEGVIDALNEFEDNSVVFPSLRRLSLDEYDEEDEKEVEQANYINEQFAQGKLSHVTLRWE